MEFEDSVKKHIDGRNSKKHPAGRKRLGDSKVTAVLDPTHYMWTGPVLMGKYTRLNMIFDTASDWLVAESSKCDNCEGNKFDPKSYGVKVSDS